MQCNLVVHVNSRKAPFLHPTDAIIQTYHTGAGVYTDERRGIDERHDVLAKVDVCKAKTSVKYICILNIS